MNLVPFLLQDWWILKEYRHGELSWDSFKEVFKDKFYTETYRKEKHDEFLPLMQGKMTVGEYEKKFKELASSH